MKKEIIITFKGNEYSADYHIERGVLHVVSAYGSKETHPGPDPRGIARLLLFEMVENYHTLYGPQKNKSDDTHQQ